MIGRPPLTDEQKNDIVQKLTPYLRAGLSVRKACIEAEVPKSSVYDYLDMDEQFTDKIRRIEQSLSVRIAMALSAHLSLVEKKLNENKEISHDEIKFLKWYATTSNKTKEEFNKREEVTSEIDPQYEIQRMMRIINGEDEQGVSVAEAIS